MFRSNVKVPASFDFFGHKIRLSERDKEALSHIPMRETGAEREIRYGTDRWYLAKQRLRPLTEQEIADQDLYEKKLSDHPFPTAEESTKYFNMLKKMFFVQLANDSFRTGKCWKCNRQTELLHARLDL